MAELKAVVVGTGMMGPGIAITLALGGIQTRLVSRTSDKAKEGISKATQLLEQLLRNELIDADAAASAKSLLIATADLDGSIRPSQLVIESITEDLALKQEIFCRLDKQADRETLLATNTSGLSITAIAAKAFFPERILATHFWNPPHLMPLVEVVMGEGTGERQAQATIKLLRQCGKTAVLVRKDRPGMLGNRMQHALVREAIHIVQEGIASPEDVDLAVMTGFGLRLPAWGVFEHADAVGLQLVKAVQDSVLPDLNRETHSSALLNKKIQHGDLGFVSGRGFYDWSVHSMEAARSRRDSFLIEFLRNRKRSAKGS
jgi:3-hydroxybutyryl-CoA dehydrogenase